MMDMAGVKYVPFVPDKPTIGIDFAHEAATARRE
jgi:hypothetical protein